MIVYILNAISVLIGIACVWTVVKIVREDKAHRAEQNSKVKK